MGAFRGDKGTDMSEAWTQDSNWHFMNQDDTEGKCVQAMVKAQ